MDTFAAYLNEASRYPLLTKDQEILLARQVQAWIGTDEPTKAQVRAGKRAYEKLINCNLRLVVSVAKRFSNRIKRSEMLDIVQEGNYGLAHGIKKYDPERGYALSTYVYWWIRQSISRYLSCSDRVIRMPSHAVEILAKLRAWGPTFEQTHGRPPTLEECAEYAKTTPDRLKIYMEHSSDSISLNCPLTNGNSHDGYSTLMDVVTDGVDLLENLEMLVRADYVEDLLERLSEIDRKIVIKHFALDGGESMSLQGIGTELGLSRERVRQRLARSLRQLRAFSRKVSSL